MYSATLYGIYKTVKMQWKKLSPEYNIPYEKQKRMLLYWSYNTAGANFRGNFP